MEILELKISVDELNRVEGTNERLNELEDITTEITQREIQKMKRVSGTCGTITKDITFISLESQEKGRKRMGLKSI